MLRYVTVQRSLDPAWPVGEYAWVQRESSHQGPSQRRPTGVTPLGRVVTMDVPTDAEEGGGTHRPIGLKDPALPLLTIAAEIEKLAEAHGV